MCETVKKITLEKYGNSNKWSIQDLRIRKFCGRQIQGIHSSVHITIQRDFTASEL